MKALLLALITSSTLASAVCDSGDIWELEKESKFTVVSSQRAVLTEEEFNKIPNIGQDYEDAYENCHDAIEKVELKHSITGEEVTMYYTIEDHCDGGNSFGSILNHKGELITEIHDSGIYCE